MLGNLFGKSKGKILVADDEATVRCLVEDVLTTQDYKVTTVADGQAAVDLLQKEKFDLLIMDVHMPRLEGPQALEVIRLLPNGKDLGVMMLTSEKIMQTFQRAFELGVAAYLNKPFSAVKLAEEVNAYFAKKNT